MPEPSPRRPNARAARDAALGELAAVWQGPRLALQAPWLLAQRRGGGRPVLVLPGRSVGDASTAALRSYLSALGYRCRGWGLGINHGDVGGLLAAFVPVLEKMATDADGPVALVGQSMGGAVAREAARAHPELVSQVITLGTPLLAPRTSRPITRPVTALYSKVDRIVPPKWAVDRTAGVDNVEVSSTHFGMGFDPDVWRIVADRLSQPGAASASEPSRSRRSA